MFTDDDLARIETESLPAELVARCAGLPVVVWELVAQSYLLGHAAGMREAAREFCDVQEIRRAA